MSGDASAALSPILGVAAATLALALTVAILDGPRAREQMRDAVTWCWSAQSPALAPFICVDYDALAEGAGR